MKMTAILALVAPTGMTDDDRDEWLSAAADALKGIPGDLLTAGIKAARKSCDHPAKLIPAVMAEVEGLWRRRLADRTTLRWLASVQVRDQAAPDATFVTPEQAATIKAEFGIARSEEKRAAARANLGPRRKPTAGDIQEIAAAMEIAPATGEGLPPAADIRGLTIAEIFAQRDRRAAEALRVEGFARHADDVDDWRATT